MLRQGGLAGIDSLDQEGQLWWLTREGVRWMHLLREALATRAAGGCECVHAPLVGYISALILRRDVRGMH